MKKSLRFRGQEGKIYQGDTYREVVEDMRAKSYSPATTLRQYMKEVSSRCKLYRPCSICWWWSSEKFVNDLVKAGFWTQID